MTHSQSLETIKRQIDDALSAADFGTDTSDWEVDMIKIRDLRTLIERNAYLERELKERHDAFPDFTCEVEADSYCILLPDGYTITVFRSGRIVSTVPLGSDEKPFEIELPELFNLIKKKSEELQIPEGYALVPLIPTEDQWGGLARSIMMWLDSTPGIKSPSSLFKHLKFCGRPIPDWLRNDNEMKTMNHTPSKGTRCAIIYRAMIEDYVSQHPKSNDLSQSATKN